MTQAPTSNLPDLEQVARIEFGQELRSKTIASRLMVEKLGTRKALTREQVATAASEFHADIRAISARKRLVDTRHPAYKEVTAILSRAKAYWKSLTVPYPEPGVRLLKRDKVEQFSKQMDLYRTALAEKAGDLQQRYDEIRAVAREQLGDLFNAGDYPQRIDQEFGIFWDFPNIEPPAYLKQVHPELYEAERQRINARFEEAVRLTEQAFVGEFTKMIGLLAERLSGDVDGKPKVFRDSAVANLREFFGQFRELNLGSNAELDALVQQAQQAIDGVQPQDLRDNESLRGRVGAQLSEISQQLSSMMVDRPVRAIDLNDDE